MPRERRYYAAECGGKVDHRSRRTALRHASHLPGMQVYRCSWCRWWHVGGEPGAERTIVAPGPVKRDNRKERRAVRRQLKDGGDDGDL